MNRTLAALGGITVLLAAPAALAAEWQFGDFDVKLNTRLSTGVAIRMQEIDYRLVGKLNVPGQELLCAPDNCLSLNLDPAPNQRLVDAHGGYFAVNGDNGNLNYDKHDLVAATSKIVPDLTVKWNDFTARFRAVGYYDPVNVDFEETNNYTLYQPRRTPRAKDVEDRYAKGIDVLEGYISYAFQWGDRYGTFSLGNQIVRWGESTLVQLNSLAEINPPDASYLRMPGTEINELFQAVPLVLLSTDLAPGISIEAFYQIAWQSVAPDPAGSFFSDTDLIAGSQYAMVSLGQFGEDPNREFGASDVLGYLSSTTLTIYPEEVDARDDGQFGVRLNYFADWLNDGTELSFYYMRYHSRLPYATVIAAEDSCARDSTNLLSAYAACNGFNGHRPLLPALNPLAPRGEPLPADTLRAQIVYPEDINMFGFSFTTNLGSWSLAGEYSFRNNLPLQLHIPDVIFAGLQPAFPANQISADPTGGGLAALVGGLASLGVDLNALAAAIGQPGLVRLLSATFPAATVAVPSYVADYRGYGRVEAGQEIPGFERQKVGQISLTAIRAFSQTILGAEQILMVTEFGMTQVYDMPSRDRLQFEGNYLGATHYSPGADGTGQPGGTPDPRTLNPTQQRVGFADDLSYGLRMLTRAEYNDAIFGWNFIPTLIVAWDIKGTAPFPMQNFVEGRKEITFGTDVNFTPALSARVLYQWFTGAGDRNTRRDRDNLAISFSYSF